MSAVEAVAQFRVGDRVRVAGRYASGVGEVLHLGQRQRVRSHGQRENRRIGRIHFVVNRRIRQIRRQKCGSRVDRGLHLLFFHIDVLIEGKLQRDHGPAKRARRGHLAQSGNLSELPLQR